MNIYFEDIFCESCILANYKTPNDYFKVSILLLHEVLFKLSFLS